MVSNFIGQETGSGDGRSKAGCPGSLTSCPGPERAAAAAMCDSGYCKSFHQVHLLLSVLAMAGFTAQYFLFFRRLTEKSNNTDPYMSAKQVLPESIPSGVCTGNVDMSNIPNVFYWHGPNSFHSKGKIYFCSLWCEQASCIFSFWSSRFKD
jgi:hypothetical protein